MKAKSTAELADIHEIKLLEWRQELAQLEEEILGLQAAETAIRLESQTANPERRSDGVGTPVTELRRKLDKAVRRRELLISDLRVKELLLEGLREEADLEREETERRAAEAAVSLTEVKVAQRWESFKIACEDARIAWADLVEAASELDRLPAGETPIVPFPADLQRGFMEALRRYSGMDSFQDDPRIVAHRIDVVSSKSKATDTRGFAHDMSSLGSY